MFLRFCQQATEIVKFMKCCVWQSFFLQSEYEPVINFAAQHQVSNIIKEQFHKYDLTQLGLTVMTFT